MSDQIDNVKTILDAGAANGAKVQDVLGIPCAVTPTQTIPLVPVIALADERADRPRRRKGTACLQAIDSFCSHVERFKSPASVIFADGIKRQFVGVLNYHPAGADSPPAWGDHRAVYPCPLSDEWKTWGAGKPIAMDQDAFAEFLDAHDRDLAINVADADGLPYAAPTDLINLAASVETHDRKATKRIRTTTGVKIEFTADSGVKSEVAIPRAFAIRVPVFADNVPTAIEVRLRVEVDGGAAQFTVQIHDSDKVLRAAFDALIAVVAEHTGSPVFVGAPEQ